MVSFDTRNTCVIILVLMDSFIVIFETETNEPKFREILKTYPKWGRITKNAYVVKSDKSATEIRNQLNTVRDSGDRVAVIKSGYTAAWNNTRVNSDWLKGNL